MGKIKVYKHLICDSDNLVVAISYEKDNLYICYDIVKKEYYNGTKEQYEKLEKEYNEQYEKGIF